MESKTEQHAEIKNRIKERSERSEEQRKQLRYTFNKDKLAKGQLGVLKNDEFVNGVLSVLRQNPDDLLTGSEEIVARLGDGLSVQDSHIRERALALLSPLLEFALGADRREILVTLAGALERWLTVENETLPGYSIMFERIGQIINWFLVRASWREAATLVRLLNKISTNSLSKGPTIRGLSGRVLDNAATKDVISRLTDRYLLHDDDERYLRDILAAFGKKAAIHNLNRVIHSQSKGERISLINLIPVYREQVVPVLSECLENDPPWSVVRNIIYIIAGIGCGENYGLVEKYFRHSDERVQHEMICCVMRLGGEEMTARLTGALMIVADRLKVYIIRLLLEYTTDDEAFFNALCDLADSQTTSSLRGGEELVAVMIAALKTFPCRDAVDVLQNLHDRCQKTPGTEQIALLIEEAVRAIEPQIRHDKQQFADGHETVVYDSDPVLQQLARGKFQKIDNRLKRLVAANDMAGVGRLIGEEAMAAVNERDFVLAGMLRDRLIEIDPMALSQAIELGELIDGEKSGSFVSHHIEIWSELYEKMSSAEFDALYSSLREERYEPGDLIIEGGETDNKLFFLNCGYISLGCIAGGRETFLKRMQPGDILGYEQFFSASVWTVNLKALTQVQVQVLDHAALEKIAAEYPNVEHVLFDFCKKYADVSRLLLMSGSDRREFPRFSGSLHTSTRLVDPFGSMSKKTYQGQLVDISKSGLAYTVKVSTKAAARLLLGRQSITDLVVEGETVRCGGVIVGVKMQEGDNNVYTVHVKLSKQIEEKAFRRIIAVLR